MKYNSTYYDKYASIYNFTRKFFLFGKPTLLELISNQENVNSISEIGCGTGEILNNLYNVNSKLKLTGYDLSESMLKIAEMQNEQIEYIKSDIFDIKEIKSDIIILSYFITLFDDCEEILNHIKKIINPNSKIYMLDFYSFDNYVYNYFMKKQGVKSIENLEINLNKYFNLLEIRKFKSIYKLWTYCISIYQIKN